MTAAAIARGRKAVKVFGIAAAIGCLMLLLVAERTMASVSDGLAVADSAAQVAGAAADPAGQLADDLAKLASSLADGTTAAAKLAATASKSSAQGGKAAQTNLATTLDGLAKTSNRLATSVERIETFIPGNKSPSAADDLREVANGLKPTAKQVRGIGLQLTSASIDLAKIADQLNASAKKVAAIGTDIAGAKATIDQVPGLVANVQTAVHRTQDRLTVDRWLIRILIIALGAALIAVAVTADRVLIVLGTIVPDDEASAAAT